MTRRAAAILLALAAAGPGCRRSVPRVTIDPKEPSAAPGASVPRDAGALPSPDPFSLTRGEARAVAIYLSKNPDLRLATDADARVSDDSADVARLYGIYHPYFVRGDVNDDGAMDFVVAFVDRRRTGGTPWFTVAAFLGDRAGGFRQPEILEREISLDRGDLSIDRDCILVTPDLGEDTNRRYRWNGLRSRFEFVSNDDGSAEPRPTNRV